MKKLLFVLTLFALTSCSKNEPTLEIDQEELGTATLIFTPVEEHDHDGHTHYDPIAGENPEVVKFTGSQLLPEVGAHVHLEVGHTYKLELKTTDFAGRESQQSFLNRADTHQAFLLGSPENTIEFTYADDQVGVTAYIKVLKSSSTSTWQYIMRHLNNGVKQNIKASDWNNANYTKFTGSNDLNLKFEVHLVENEHNH